MYIRYNGFTFGSFMVNKITENASLNACHRVFFAAGGADRVHIQFKLCVFGILSEFFSVHFY